jgi:hypothetical protein
MTGRSRPRRRSGGTFAQRRKGHLIGAAMALGLLAWGLGIWVSAGVGEGSENGGARAGATAAGGERTTGPVQIGDDFDWNIFDERLLIGYSENVFAGRVTEKVGTKTAHTTIPGDDEDPHTQYAVDVLEVVKATGPKPLATGESAIVDQLGGPGAKTGWAHVATAYSCHQLSVSSPLVVGREYLFATYYDAATRRHDVSAPPAGAKPIGSGANAEAVVSAYRRAAEQQIDPLSGKAPPCPRKDAS